MTFKYPRGMTDKTLLEIINQQLFYLLIPQA